MGSVAPTGLLVPKGGAAPASSPVPPEHVGSGTIGGAAATAYSAGGAKSPIVKDRLGLGTEAVPRRKWGVMASLSQSTRPERQYVIAGGDTLPTHAPMLVLYGGLAANLHKYFDYG